MDVIDLAKQAIQDSCPTDPSEWNVLGFITPKSEILSFGSDSKIVGRLFEIIAKPFLQKAANREGWLLGESKKQTVYPDFWFELTSGKRIEIDIKSTYRSYNSRGDLRPFNFTLGAYSSFLRNGSKNIDGNYTDYIGHLIFGFLYTRNKAATVGKTNIRNIDQIIPSYREVEFFIQEKYKIAGEKKGSGNTNNIATIKALSLMPFRQGRSYFTTLGNKVFEDYWKNYPLYTDSAEAKAALYSNLDGYIQWLRKSGREDEANQTEKVLKKWRSDPINKNIK